MIGRKIFNSDETETSLFESKEFSKVFVNARNAGESQYSPIAVLAKDANETRFLINSEAIRDLNIKIVQIDTTEEFLSC